MAKKKGKRSGETSKKVVKTAAAFLALDENERYDWIRNPINWRTITSWAASLVTQAPNKKKRKDKSHGK